MRSQAITLSLLHGLIKHGWVEAFRVASHSSRALRSTVSSVSRCTTRDAPVVSSDHQVFAEGGAEKIAELLAGESAGEGAVFYNRVGAINRDLSVLMANVLAEERLKESLAGRKRKKWKEPLPSQPSPDDAIKQCDSARRRSRWGVRAFLSGALARSSRGRWGGSDATVLAEGRPTRDTRPHETDTDEGLVVLDAFAASGVRALRCVPLHNVPMMSVIFSFALFVWFQ